MSSETPTRPWSRWPWPSAPKTSCSRSSRESLRSRPSVTRFSLGDEPGDERIVNVIGGGYGKEPGQFVWPSGIALDSDRNIYVTDAWTDRVSVFTVDGDFIRSFGSSGHGDGQFRRPSGIDIDDLRQRSGRRYPQRPRFRSSPVTAVSFHSGVPRGSAPGEFRSPWGITIDTYGYVYVADYKNHRIQKFDPDGGFMFAVGSHGAGDYEFDHPSDVAVDPAGDIYVCDWANSRVQAYDADRQVHHHVHRGRLRAVEVAEGVRPSQPGRSQGAPPGLFAGTRVAFRAAYGNRLRPPRLQAHGRRHSTLANPDLQQAAGLQRTAVQYMRAGARSHAPRPRPIYWELC